MLERIKSYIGNKHVCILGFGAEGQSTFRLLSRILPDSQISIADKSPDITKHPLLNDRTINVLTAENYLRDLSSFDLIIKTPGLPFSLLEGLSEDSITSQTELFIRAFSSQIIGITGTKGKSTTSSLIYHIVKQSTENVILVGNIGIPPFDLIERIDKRTIIVYELSSHQLQQIRYSPHTAILLNLFEEHLDHYNSKEEYFGAKLNIMRHQGKNDFFIYPYEEKTVMEYVQKQTMTGHCVTIGSSIQSGISCYLKEGNVIWHCNSDQELTYKIEGETALKGIHNQRNCMFAIAACKLNNIPDTAITKGLRTFQPLAHRLEYVGFYGGLHYYNDSIATIPEAVMAAVTAIPNIGTLLLGGYDRGIDYRGLVDFLCTAPIDNLVFMGAAGMRIKELLDVHSPLKKKLFIASDMAEAVAIAKKQTAPGKACLLSPAAASYDMFRNFEERGATFRQLAMA